MKTVDHVLVYVGHVDVRVNPNEVDQVQWVDQRALKAILADRLLLLLPLFSVVDSFCVSMSRSRDRDSVVQDHLAVVLV